MDKREMMEISLKQQKVISDPLRSRIIAMLHEKPMTPKQTSEQLGKNAGTIYYHIQQLFKHDILEIDHIETNKGVVEKYYRSKAVLFRGPEDQEGVPNHVEASRAHVLLSEELLSELNNEVRELLYKYGNLSFKEGTGGTSEQKPYVVDFQVTKYEDKEEE
ncbi:ArsR/SmtB family transcription factor [Alkalicoccobacillus murimartini]|uniref:DNA-binding transcriptional ArsR family regulator n=1 Tax=Alkalicoccobacillus murimartini TaxID=171685 RepID=A0ABT9YM32_9BACI|nr:winged helix-turn-helix domain-containing protein [Alkalicoccobacillus murimartini]MDQ0208704.1 DNA-binding transcriptional ArsR family regulator [Alkalicoccobacillus murimartini]